MVMTDMNYQNDGPVFIGNAGGNRSQWAVFGGFYYMSGVRGTDPVTGKQVPGPGVGNTPGDAPNADERIIQIYENIKTAAAAQGLTLQDCVRLDTYLVSAAYIGPTADLEALPQFWGPSGPFPPRTHIGVPFLSGSDTEQEVPGVPRGDIVEVTAVFAKAPNGHSRI